MDAAVTVFARRGVEAAPISEIAATARVSNGTFYYHFKDKAELIDAVGHAVAAALVNQVDEEIKAIESGAERVALATQLFIRHAATESEWGWMVVQAMIDMGQFRDQISRGIRKDVAIGVKQGHFDIESSNALFTMLLSVVGVALRQRLENPNGRNVEMMASEIILRMLGVAPAEARRLPNQVMVKHLGRQKTGKDGDRKPHLKLI